jgi:hypothetical protein
VKMTTMKTMMKKKMQMRETRKRMKRIKNDE